MSLWDFAIVGAGPTGASAAAFLARAGYSVIVLEQEIFPRFRIGESLLPLGVRVLRELGVDLDQAPYALRKEGAKVLSESDRQQYRIAFDDTLPGCFPYAYQVERAPFDHAIAQRAQALGAEICFNTRVKSVHELEDRVILQTDGEQITSRYLLDASGPQTLIARSMGRRQRVRGLGRAASFTHFSNVTSPEARDLFSRGDIALFLNKDTAWGWAIPLANQRAGLGVVRGEGHPLREPQACFQEFIDSSPLVQRLLVGASQERPVRRCSDYSYYASPSFTRRMAVVGDAHAFLDPVFSSGVSLGLYASQELARVLPAMVNADLPLELDAYYQYMSKGYQVFERILERFYRPGWAMTTFFMPEKPTEMVQQLNTILAGEVWREDNTWQNMLLASKRRTVFLENQTSLVS